MLRLCGERLHRSERSGRDFFIRIWLKILSMQGSGEDQPGKRLPGKLNESCLSPMT
jgi:hypothetical protein